MTWPSICKHGIAVELSEADERYLWLLENSSEAILLHAGGRVALVNRPAMALFGADDAHLLIDKHVADLIQMEVGSASIHPRSPSLQRTSLARCKLLRLNRSVIDATITAHHCHYQNQPAVQLLVRNVDDRRWAEPSLSALAQYDQLTELPDRNQFLGHLGGAIARAARNQQLVGVIFLAVDHFKTVNRLLGHRGGDAALKQIAERLKQCVRKGDILARLGGDEFSIILEGLTEKQELAMVAHRMLKAVSRPLLLDREEIRVSISIGIAVSSADTDDVDQLLFDASSAMCYAKECGRNNYRFYSPNLDACGSADEMRRAEIEPRFARLTPREREVLDMIIAGNSNKVIAQLLGASSRTIETHRANIMDKMQAESLPELMRMTLEFRTQ
jgi:diguanylate cyclase (GGDEF)-like protein